MIKKTAIYKPGDVVCSKVNPQQALLIRLYAHKVYYCNVKNNPTAKEQVYFERELIPFKVSS